MMYSKVSLVACFVILAITNCNGIDVFKLLKSANQCATNAAPKACITNKVTEFCNENQASGGKRIQAVCACVNGPEDTKDCVKGKIETFCANNTDDFKCDIFQQCKKHDGEGVAVRDAQKQCVVELCKENQDKFECQAIGCKLKSPGTSRPEKKARLECIQNVCTSMPSEPVCNKIQTCKDQSKGLFRKLKFLKCVKKLFEQ